jgi:Transcriptional regulator
MTTKAFAKKEYILKKAEQVFIRRGINGVTMKDIIEECGISRGGIYLYYSSVDDIFIDVIKYHNASKLEQVKSDIQNQIGFEVLLTNYFTLQKEHLLHLENSLLLAMYEFYFSHKDGSDKNFFFAQFHNTKSMITQILCQGVAESKIENCQIDPLSDLIMFLIEGLSTLAIAGGITPELLDSQFSFITSMVQHQFLKENA